MRNLLYLLIQKRGLTPTSFFIHPFSNLTLSYMYVYPLFSLILYSSPITSELSSFPSRNSHEYFPFSVITHHAYHFCIIIYLFLQTENSVSKNVFVCNLVFRSKQHHPLLYLPNFREMKQRDFNSFQDITQFSA